MITRKHLLTVFSVLLIAALLAACGSPAAAPTPTPVPPTAAPAPPTPVPPTATSVPTAPAEVTATPATSAEAPGEYADVNDIRMYYEIHGEGEPLLLLHGGAGCTKEWDFGHQVEAFSQKYMVIAPDSRAQGRTTDSDQPLTYELMAEDMIGLLDYLGIESAHVVGWSDGGDTALNMAVNHPNRVRSLVVTGAQYRADGMIPEEIEWAENMSEDSFPSFFLDLCYREIAPDPDHLPVMLEKLKNLFLLEDYVPYEKLGTITAPVLILEGEEPDFLLHDHVEKLAAAIPTATLQWIPGVGHMAPIDKSSEWNAAVFDFLAQVDELAASGEKLESKDEATVEPHGLRYDAPEYAIDGGYGVGVRYFTIPAESETDRELVVSVWYPAEESDGAPNEMVYEPQFPAGEVPAFTVLGHASLNAPPDLSGGPYPLVVYSHSHWSFGQENPYLAEHLASQGFVVISTDHEDNWSTAFGPIAPEAYMRRPQEVTRQIDFAESLSSGDGLLAGLVDTKKVGVAGWSQGAMTALSAGGARLDLANASTWCKENPETAELNSTACPDMEGHADELASFSGLAEVPEGLWPDWSDPRIGAVIAMAPSTIPFGKDGIQSVSVPVMFMVGSGETSTDGGFEMADPYGSVSLPDTFLGEQ